MSNSVDKWKGKMRRSATGEAVGAFLNTQPLSNPTERSLAQPHQETAPEQQAVVKEEKQGHEEPSPGQTSVQAPIQAAATAAEQAAALKPMQAPITLPSRKKFEETHTRSTFYVENEILDLLNNLAVEKGQKTYIVNEALRRFLDALQTS